jgi:hypothetical protein
VIDRGHNLAGQSVELHVSNDAFTTFDGSISWTMPSAWSPGSLDEGAFTEEGAFVRRFDVRIGRYWRLYVPAVAGWKPEIVGLWLGLAWYPDELAVRPHDPGAAVAQRTEFVSEFGWRGGGRAQSGRAGSLRLRIGSFIADDHRRRFTEHYRLFRPAWYVPDEEEASSAMLVQAPTGSAITAPLAGGWAYPQIDLPYTEHEPLVR